MLHTINTELAKRIQNQPTKVHAVKLFRDEVKTEKYAPTLRECIQVIEYLWVTPITTKQESFEFAT